MRATITILATIGLLLVAVGARCQTTSLDAVASSHVDANVPPASDFDRILRRDLTASFSSKLGGGPLTVEYELLRDGPTQAGAAYPKFYAWVTARDGGALLREGAVRLAAIGRQRFEVTDFLSVEDIRRSPDAMPRLFPASVCERIRARIGPWPGS